MTRTATVAAPVAAPLVRIKHERSPFPWFGGKSRVAAHVWKRFGNVPNYIEPFVGSMAVPLGRPHEPRVETVNDKDLYIANFWRALKAAPHEVAKHCDWPVNEADLHARHRWLVTEGRERLKRIKRSATFYDARVAGYWVYGQCLWIGSGWCADDTWNSHRGSTVQKRPASTGNGQAAGVHRLWLKRPAQNRRGSSNGIHRESLRRWQGGGQGGGSGVHSPSLWNQLPDLSGSRGATGRGIHRRALSAETDGLYEYLYRLSVRLRRVRVCVGDWRRVLTPSISSYIGITGIFLDPPYRQDLRAICYSEDHDISDEVREWAIANGDNPKLRIALCGYEDEHKMPTTWETFKWKAHGGYGRTERAKRNREAERIWFSPHCLKPASLPLFEGVEH